MSVQRKRYDHNNCILIILELYTKEVDDVACHGPRENYVTMEEERRKRRELTRVRGLVKWEDSR